MAWDSQRTKFDRSFAVVIGINHYQNGIHPLTTAVNDAESLADLLEEDEYRVIRLFPPHAEATLTKINELLDEVLPCQICPTDGDRLLFYFAGHGITRQGKAGPAGYLIPQDAHLENPDSFLPMQRLCEAFDQLHCHHLLVILDCCYAGMFRWSTRKLAAIPDRIHREHYDRFIRYPSWQVIASSAHNQEALDLLSDQRGTVSNQQGTLADPNKPHSPFALALMRGLGSREADFTQDGVIIASELHLYLEKYVSQWSGEQQTPGFWSLRPEFDRGEYVFTKLGFDPLDPLHGLKTAPPLDEQNNPYRGLKPFEERHARFFFGRQTLTKALGDRSATHPLTIVLGGSGSGKSSLVRAGLIPHLRKQRQWYILDPMRPGESPYTALARAILPIVEASLTDRVTQLTFLDKAAAEILRSQDQTRIQTLEALKTSETSETTFNRLAIFWSSATPEAKLLLVLDYFVQLRQRFNQADEAQLADLYAIITERVGLLASNLATNSQYLSHLIDDWAKNHPDIKLLLVIDQFEELITLSKSQSKSTSQRSESATELRAQQFLETLRFALVNHARSFRIVVTLRSDFEPRFLDSDLKDQWQSARFLVRPMNSDELREAIESPALEQALYFEPSGIVGRLIDEVGQTSRALPLLSFTLSERYVKLHQAWTENPRATERALTLDADFDRQGGVAGFLTRRATEEYEGWAKRLGQTLGKAYQETMRRILLRMITLEGGGAARRRVLMSELVCRDSLEKQRVDEIVECLIDARLLIKDQEAGDSYIEPAHDFLVRGWDKLQEWIAQEQRHLILQRRLTSAALTWQQEQQERFLWNADPSLDELVRLMQSQPHWFNQMETEFVQRSIQRKHRNVRRRWQIAAAVLTVVSSLAVYSAIQNQISWLRARSAIVQNIAPVKPLEATVQIVGAIGHPLSRSVVDVQSSLLSAIETPKERAILRGSDQSAIRSVAIVAREWTVGVQDSGRLVAWNRQGKSFSPSNQNIAATAVAACSDVSAVWVGDRQGNLGRWNLLNNQVQTIGQQDSPSAIMALALSRDCQTIASLSREGLYLWNQQGDGLRPGFAHRRGIPLVVKNSILQNNILPSQITTIALSPDGQQIAAGDSNGTIWMWRTDGKWVEVAFANPPVHPNGLYTIAFSPDGRFLVSGGGDRLLRLWNRATGKQVGESFHGHEDTVASVVFSADGQSVVSGSYDNSIRLWNLQGDQIGEALHGHASWVRSVTISIDGQAIASGSNDGTVRMWNGEAEKIRVSFRNYRSRVRVVAFNASGDLVASGDEASLGTVHLWNQQGNLMSSPSAFHNGAVWAIAMSDDGKTIVSGGEDGMVRLWNQQGNLIRSPFSSDNRSVEAVAVTTDGSAVVSSGSEGVIQIWDRQGNATRAAIDISVGVRAVAFSRDGQLIASGSNDGIVRLWSRQGNLLREFPQVHRLPIESIAFSPNADLIASGSQDNTLQLWSQTGKAAGRQFRGHNGWVSAIAFSPDGQFVATGSWDKTVRLWDIQGNAMGKPLRGHQEWISAVRFSPDGQLILSGSGDKTVRVWTGGNAQTWLDIACEQLREPVRSQPTESPELIGIKAAATVCQNRWNRRSST